MEKIIALGALIAVTSLSAISTEAGPSRLKTDLNGGNEIIDTNIGGGVTLPVKGLLTGAYGTARITISPDHKTISYTLNVSKTATPIFMAHIHVGPPDRNGPVILWLFGDAASNPLPITLPRDDGPFTGVISGTLAEASLAPQANLGLTTFEDAIQNIVRGNAYVNVHTVANPPGEVRGQLGGHSHFDF